MRFNITFIVCGIYAFLVNFISFIVVLYDKRISRLHGKKRVDENSFFLLAAIGGAVGLLFGMIILRHKTRKRKFKYGIPLILIIQISVIVFVIVEKLY